ncbi:hypothetical protein SAMN05443248_0936 [Bradyrhizobium erythrophlei]|jgi:hypothetical protein|uniref:Uncharacterized protein n=1 Tax=Bradyrhizobium erythrophlei TaxID=1437360 RepID=A0A1M5IDS0_9BRAD|nr:hypothetical protein SAMN05443248_0936 [Bradyrhizobium erythrophlei]
MLLRKCFRRCSDAVADLPDCRCAKTFCATTTTPRNKTLRKSSHSYATRWSTRQNENSMAVRGSSGLFFCVVFCLRCRPSVGGLYASTQWELLRHFTAP